MRNLTTKKKGLVLKIMVGKKDIPFEMELWYFGRIKRERGEELLKHNINVQGSFLVRKSEKDDMNFTLVVKNYDEKRRKICYSPI